MNTPQHYSGLTEAEVLESRRKYGVNILTPKAKASFWDLLKKTCSHWISVSLFILLLGSVITWVMPGIVLLATLLIILVGLFGGFKDSLYKILIVAFVLSIGIAIYEYKWCGADFSTFFEPIGIIVALLVATGVAYILERKNEKTFQSLNEVNDDTPVKAIRNNQVQQVPRKDIVVGDIVILETGEEVPADCELLEALNLIVNESSLTGELQAEKTTNPDDYDKEATYPSNYVMKGTTIVEGYCTARVLQVGDCTESGKVFVAAQVDQGEATPLSKKLDSLARIITNASYIIAALVIIGRLGVYITLHWSTINGQWPMANGQYLLDFITYLLQTVMIAVTLIVVAVPEGLPMSVTLSLAFSMRKLMKQNTLPRTMHACETMGAASVICTDKTGTLTQNQMKVAHVRLAEGITTDMIAEMIAVNTTANLQFASGTESPRPIGNPTEGALLLWLYEQGFNYLTIRESVPVVDRQPFSTVNKYMSTTVRHTRSGETSTYIKGAPEIVLNMCQVDEKERQAYEALLLDYQNKGMRTLALAVGHTTPLPLNGLHHSPLLLEGSGEAFTFVGIFAISDPVRPEVPAAVRSCIDAGIQVKIVTGDTSATAREIARQIGLWNDDEMVSVACSSPLPPPFGGVGGGSILTGTEFAAMSDEQATKAIQDMKILSRARPGDKERLVRLLKAAGHVVAVTGDGTNDAPALNAADVGLSMGDGTAVAKEASDMTIQDNSFSTIANAVMWGRSLYKNIQRFILFQTTINVVACLIVLIGAFTGTQSPLTVTQMLWVNLIMDTFAAIALASLPPSKKVMQEKPRTAGAPIISRPMACNIIGTGLLFTVLLTSLLLFMQHSGGVFSPYEQSLFFTIFVMLQFWNMFNAKAFMTKQSAFAHLKHCTGFQFIALVILVGQIAIVQFGGQMFSVTPLHPRHWLVLLLLTSAVLWTGEAVRYARRVKGEG